MFRATASCGAWPAEALVAYLDGELPPQSRTRLAAHLPTCAACQQHLATLQGTARLLQGATPLIEDPAARHALLTRSRAESGSES